MTFQVSRRQDFMQRPYGLLRVGFPYVKTIGTFGTTHPPADLAFGREGRIYVICHIFSKVIRIINSDDDDLGWFGVQAREFPLADGEFYWPVQIIVDSDERVYVSDQASHRISVFSHEGEFLGKWGDHGHRDGQIDRPSGIVFDPEENVLVVDTLNHRVQKFTKGGQFISNWGVHGEGEGEMRMPWGIAADGEGFVYVSDWRNDRVQKFTSDGEYVFAFGNSGSGKGEFRGPAGIDVDGHGDIYVADRGNSRIQVFDPDGNYVQQFQGDSTLSKSALKRMFTRDKKYHRIRSSADVESLKFFKRPRSVAVDDQFRMFVPDYEHYRIQIYQKEAYTLSEEEIAPPLRSPTTQLG